MPKEFTYQQRKQTKAYEKGWERVFGGYCPINIDNPEICSAGTCKECIEYKENKSEWESKTPFSNESIEKTHEN